jgi:hypothetical protein
MKVGEKHGNWLVIGSAVIVNRKKLYLCKCDCGVEKLMRKDDVIKKPTYCNKCRFASVAINSGDKFGKWTVVRQVEKEEKRKHYEVKCECGSIKVLKGIRLRFGDSICCRKCGSTKHGKVHSKTYSTWECMIQITTNPKHVKFKHYGGRGIKVCEEWLLFENFYKDMGERPLKYELDRIDNNGNYELSNCRWITHRDNLLNRG